MIYFCLWSAFSGTVRVCIKCICTGYPTLNDIGIGQDNCEGRLASSHMPELVTLSTVDTCAQARACSKEVDSMHAYFVMTIGRAFTPGTCWLQLNSIEDAALALLSLA